MAGEFDYSQIQGVRGNTFVTREFIEAVEEMAERLETEPQYVLAAMSFETGGTFNPAIQNSIGATGLIQFLRSTAIGLGTTTEILKNMSAVEQLEFVEKYFDPFAGRLDTLVAVYTSILSGSPREPEDVLFRAGTPAFRLNPLDWNQDGEITAAEAATPVAARLVGGVKLVQQRLVDQEFVPDNLREGFADGRWGKNTSEALARFQRSKNLPETGLMDEATGAELFPETVSNPVITQEVVLERGSEGAAVEALQDNFVSLGYMTIEAIAGGHGTFGPRTEAAVNLFQGHVGLDVTGKFGDREQKIVDDVNAGVSRGNSNTQVVKAIQNRLIALGFMTQTQVNTGPGTFGGQTETAVKNLQTRNNLPASGIVEPVTYKALFNSETGLFTPVAGINFMVAHDDILITEQVREKVERLAGVYRQETGERLIVTSGYRPPFRQARAMYENAIDFGEATVRATYTATDLVDEILAAFRPQRNNPTAAIAAMQAVIEAQIRRGRFISNHLLSNAVDVRKRTTRLSVLRAAAASVGGRVVVEGNHYHIELPV